MENDLLRRAEDLYDRCERTSSVTATAFLTPAESHMLERAFAHRQIRPYCSGGAEDCERRCAFFLPYYLSPEEFDCGEYITCVTFKSWFGEPTHRDYLGAALAQGIKREWLGDIRVSGDTAYLLCLKSVAPLLLAMERVGRWTVRASPCALSEVPSENVKTTAVSFTVQSPRLDAVVGGAFRMSRNAAAEQIRLGLVSLNYEVCERVDAQVREGDVLSLRGKGKGTVTAIGGRSRKDRSFVTVERRL